MPSTGKPDSRRPSEAPPNRDMRSCSSKVSAQQRNRWLNDSPGVNHAAVALHEPFGVTQIVALVLTLAGLVLATRS
jgi:hypothetical protein